MVINNRLVTHDAISRMVSSVYRQCWQCINEQHACSYYVYISIQVPGIQIDVNVHPAKETVQMVDEVGLITHLQ